MNINLEMVETLSAIEPKTITERFLKLAEEHGELAQEILINRQASGVSYKAKTKDGIANESVDIILCALSIFFKDGGDISKLQKIIDEKCRKWKRYQDKV